eukprot:CAMPEP_0181173734 /NCGR_PEP_ID=MMETSP1096-20121128/3159_1 /TAXON_ID=156174 ORGANISM="Chrysochromulina ericina, Strain CCMP281" /NCGR_SAMPLE_ID=MMETSP1096 /ASSEMBLY_ACC=CAM_ASM_000453 /LENGTH=150 /DNA_ID=CAMNT_0023261585 /DNA_START=508 /DNA_END=957 /DNA_ORIENTATION=-
MRKRATEMARASVVPSPKATTRRKPATTRTKESATAIRISEATAAWRMGMHQGPACRVQPSECVAREERRHASEGQAQGTSPVARPRMILTEAWLPAFPPAPTSIVMKYTITGCDCISASLPSKMNEDADWQSSSPKSQEARERSDATNE